VALKYSVDNNEEAREETKRNTQEKRQRFESSVKGRCQAFDVI